MNSLNMPMFVVNTNVARGDVPTALLSEATEELAKAMGKPAQVGLTAYSGTTCLLYLKVKLFPPSLLNIHGSI